MAITADTKDWTWVLDRACPECGFDAAEVEPTTIGEQLRAGAPRWRAVLARPGARDRPADSVWAPVEYGCHVRDMMDLFGHRVRLMTAEDGPDFADWDQDAAAVEARYDAADPAEVADQIAASADSFTAALRAVVDWSRPGYRSNGSNFTLATLSVYGLHDYLHHLDDVAG